MSEFDPDSYEPQLLRGILDTGRYPSTVEAVRIDVRWFEHGDFSFHYVETTVESHWECRWVSHPNPHNTRLHFHEPPTGDSCRDLRLKSTHPLDVTATVLAAIDQRIDDHWAETEPGETSGPSLPIKYYTTVAKNYTSVVDSVAYDRPTRVRRIH